MFCIGTSLIHNHFPSNWKNILRVRLKWPLQDPTIKTEDIPWTMRKRLLNMQISEVIFSHQIKKCYVHPLNPNNVFGLRY